MLEVQINASPSNLILKKQFVCRLLAITKRLSILLGHLMLFIDLLMTFQKDNI